MRYDALTFLRTLFRDAERARGPQIPVTSPTRPGDLPLRWRVEWEERAAIREYCGGMPRQEAEEAAFTDVIRMMPMAENGESQAGDSYYTA